MISDYWYLNPCRAMREQSKSSKSIEIWGSQDFARWRYQMETFSALLANCTGNSPVPGEFPAQRPVTTSFDVFFDLHPNKRLSKQWWGWWFEMLSCPWWRQRNGQKETKKELQWTHNVRSCKSRLTQWYTLFYTLRWRQDGCHFFRRPFHMQFLERKLLNFK